MSHTDLRDWLEAVESRGELQHINGASWDLEMGAITELVYREGKDPKPAMLFDEVPGYPKGYRTLFGMVSSLFRIAKTLGLPEDEINYMRVHENWFNKDRDIRHIPPRFVTSGPVQQNILTGKQIDVLKFPVPRYHELDRNRYFGTCHAVIQKDPDAGWVNLGTYRVMVVDRNHLALHAVPGSHGNIILYQKYFNRGKAMPVAVATGLDPVLWWLSCQRDTPWGVSEYDRAGGIKGKPIEVIEGKYTGLPLPAHAEIVVEGECHPGDFVDEGPFGEWHGYYANKGLATVPEPIIQVKAIYHRDDPIFSCAQPGAPTQTESLMLAVAHSAAIRRRLEAFGIPGVKGIWCHYPSDNGGLFNVISIEQLYAGHARQTGLIASQYPLAMGGYTVVVEDDIDPSNMGQVIWAMTTRARLDRSVQIVPNCPSSNVDPTIPTSEKRATDKPKPLTAARVVIDACRDLSWKEDWYPIARISPELRTKTIEKWTSVLSKLT